MPDDLLEQAKLAALAEFAAGAGHEINNPVATIVGRAQQLLRGETDPAKRHALATIVGQAYRIRDMIGDLMVFARPPEPEPTRFDLAATARDVVESQRENAGAREIELAASETADVYVWADRSQIAVALAEMLRNAIEASPENGRIEIALSERDDSIVCEVIDEGTGFLPEEREHAFDPFYSGRQAGRGLGFGLPKAWRIVTGAGGTIEIDSSGNRTVVRIVLPRDSSIRDESDITTGR